ncbi:MAG: hypothetical protein ACK417_07870 [Bacteroidia bacterium]
MKHTHTIQIALIGGASRHAESLLSLPDGFQLVHAKNLQLLADEQRYALVVLEIDRIEALPVTALLEAIQSKGLRATQLVLLQNGQVVYGAEACRELALPWPLGQFSLSSPIRRLKDASWRWFAQSAEVLACMDIEQQLPACSKPLAYFSSLLRAHAELLDTLQQSCYRLISELREQGPLSWEAGRLLDSVTSLLLVNDLMRHKGEAFEAEEGEEFARLIHYTFRKLLLQLLQIQFVYNQPMLVHWLFNTVEGRETDVQGSIAHMFPCAAHVQWYLPDHVVEAHDWPLKYCWLKLTLLALPPAVFGRNLVFRIQPGMSKGEWHLQFDGVNWQENSLQEAEAALVEGHQANMEDVIRQWTGSSLRWQLSEGRLEGFVRFAR